MGYYSVDRRGHYHVGQALGLFAADPNPNRPLLPGAGYSDADLRQHLAIMFPNGLSLHGWSFLANHLPPGIQGYVFASQSYKLMEQDGALELIWEYVRRAGFAQMPSRLQSYFAFDDLAAARAFRETAAPGKPIYEVEADFVHRFDQAWLASARQGVTLSLLAHRYWGQSASPGPRWEHIMVPPMRVLQQVA